ncbi:ATP-binding protein [Micromonospora sp. NPDC007220]|uniref:NACHT domain-containing protein n=1 Tax=Micromonospora sp. NPDC007220 TaxID=3154318 RepID=UPI0033DCF95B
MQDGTPRSARFFLQYDTSAFPEKVEVDGKELTYRSFLASPYMADLRGVARNAVNIVGQAGPYVSPLAELLEQPLGLMSPEDADSLLSRLSVPGEGRTLVVFLSAEAGVGKTSLLRHVARRKAIEYLNGATESLWLYVDAQGRRLAQLDEALAAELDDLRARFPYHAISPLVRCGAMIVAIDGFDELVGSIGSYEEAFSSLAKFISDLSGHGCLVTAARSSYYEQEFLTRTNTVLEQTPDAWHLQGVRLLDWDEGRRTHYLRLFGADQGLVGGDLDEFEGKVSAVLATPEVKEVAGKPLFVKSTADVLLEDALPGGATLLDRLVAGYINREVTKKLRAGSGRPLLTTDQFRFFLTELAEEMWRQEVRQLSYSSVKELGRLLGELMELQGEALAEVVERLPSAALLSPGTLPGSLAFEHDIFYSYFLADPIADTWAANDPSALGRLLRRGRLPEEAAALAGRRARDGSMQTRIDCLSSSLKYAHGDVEQVRRNAGNLAASIVAGLRCERLSFRGLVMGDVRLAGTELQESTFVDCRFVGTDLSGVRFVQCTASNLTFDRPLVEPSSTTLDFAGLAVDDFYGIGIRVAGGERWLYSPREMRSALEACGLPAAGTPAETRRVRSEIIDLVDRLCRIFSKTNTVTETDGNGMPSIVGNSQWMRVRSAFLASGILSEEVKSAGGQKLFLKRHARPQDIMAGVDPRAVVPVMVQEFWSLLEEK